MMVFSFFNDAVLFSDSQSEEITNDDLTTLAIRYGTDKGIDHDYTPVYESYFTSLRKQHLKFLEIGFYKGSSARMWDAYFPQADLHFIDIIPEAFTYANGLSSRCQFHIVDQANKDDLLRFIQKVGGDFDIIIDDGGHTMNQQITSFKTLFPYVKSGGIYIIEDLHTSYWVNYGGSGDPDHPKTNQDSTVCFLQTLVDDVNFIGATTQHANKNKCPKEVKDKLNYHQRHIRSIHFYDSLCFIFKE